MSKEIYFQKERITVCAVKTDSEVIFGVARFGGDFDSKKEPFNEELGKEIARHRVDVKPYCKIDACGTRSINAVCQAIASSIESTSGNWKLQRDRIG